MKRKFIALRVMFGSAGFIACASFAHAQGEKVAQGSKAVLESIDEHSAAAAGVSLYNSVRPKDKPALVAPSEKETIQNMGANGGKVVLPEEQKPRDKPKK